MLAQASILYVKYVLVILGSSQHADACSDILFNPMADYTCCYWWGLNSKCMVAIVIYNTGFQGLYLMQWKNLAFSYFIFAPGYMNKYSWIKENLSYLIDFFCI